MISYSEAFAKVTRTGRIFSKVEDLPLQSAVGRITANAYRSEQVIPEFGNSAMDGFAVRSNETQAVSTSRPLRLKVLGTIAAGDKMPHSSPLIDGEINGVSDRAAVTWEIMTGAPIPNGFDGVVKVEDVTILERDTQGEPKVIQIHAPVRERQFYRAAGTDFQVGTPLIEMGTRLSPEHVLAFATLGIDKLKVFKKPKVRVISTGKEVAPGGTIRNSTAPFLESALVRFGVDVTLIESTGDDPKEFIRTMEETLAATPDVLITTGGISMGKHDFVPAALRDLGAVMEYHQIAMRPGKPNLFGQFEQGMVVFGLPGNPISTAVGLRFLIEPFLRTLFGMGMESPLRARLKADFKKPEGMRCFLKAKMESTDSGLGVSILEGQDSFMVRPLLEANAWAVAPEGTSTLSPGDVLDVFPLNGIEL